LLRKRIIKYIVNTLAKILCHRSRCCATYTARVATKCFSRLAYLVDNSSHRSQWRTLFLSTDTHIDIIFDWQ